jgi:6-phosphogluconolactonase/glucosamine-6-phosphate isomerase/deaminase
MNGEPPAIRYPDIAALSTDLAQQLAEGLRAALASRGVASLVVSGGR